MPGPIPEDFIETVRDAVDIVDVVSEYVVLKKTGQNYVGLCPFHIEKTPSFTVSPSKQIFYCFGCGIGGNVFTFLMKIENLSFPEAVEALARRVGLEVPRGKKSTGADSPREKYFEINQLAAEFYHQVLVEEERGEKARRYLQERGITTESWKRFRLGFAPDDGKSLQKFLESKGYPVSMLLELGLIVSRKGTTMDRFRERIIFPIYDPKGRCLGFGGRTLGDDLPKYLNSPDTPVFSKSRNLYGMHLALPGIREEKRALVVEGYLDCISMHQFGFTNAVAALGTAFTREQARLLLRYTKEVVLAFDRDAAGSAASLRGAGYLQELGGKVYVLDLPSGKDPDEFLQTHGHDAFQTVLKERVIPYLEFKIKQLKSHYDPESVHGRAEIINQLLDDLLKVDDLVVRDGYIETIAKHLQVPGELVRAQFYRHLSRLQTKKDRNEKNRNTMGKGKQIFVLPRESAVEVAKRGLFRMMCQDQEVWKKVKNELGLSVFQEGELEPYVRVLESSGWSGPAGLLDFLGEEQQARLANLLLDGEEQELDETLKERLIRDYIRVLKTDLLKKEIEKRQTALREREKSGDLEGIKALLAELNQLYVRLEGLKHTG
ncbi:MAG: DNA primase [Thermoanaerobacterales bacterium 50_218]|nr:MAG: DNA primase [Thermoanaerobacterales bacterium 50_218]HAA89134.1 DNA primase [Peptococcaceae bacterium]